MEWSESGFKFSCFTDTLEDTGLPRGTLNIEWNKRYTKFTTHELVRLAKYVQFLLTLSAQAQRPYAPDSAGGIGLERQLCLGAGARDRRLPS